MRLPIVRAAAAALIVAFAACTGDRAVVAPSPGAPTTRTEVTVPRPDAIMMVRTPSAAAGERGGTTLQLEATVANPVGHELPHKRHVDWSSSDEARATVDTTGLVTALDTGRVTIVVDHKKSADSVRLLIIPVPVRSIALAGALDSISLDDTLSLAATPLDSVGEPLLGRPIQWSSSDPSVAEIGEDGQLVAKGIGVVTATASVATTDDDGVPTTVSQSATVRVWPQPVATVEVTPSAPTVPLFRALSATVVLRDRRGRILSGRAVTWSSSAEAVLTVAPSGPATATASTVDVGSADLVAESEGKEGRASVEVTNPVEARALWVTRFDYTGASAVTPGKIATIMQKAASANFNIVYFQVRTAGDALYASTIEPCSPRVCGTLGGASMPGGDPIAVALAEAAKYTDEEGRPRIEVHAWLNAYTGWIAGSTFACNQLNASTGASHMLRQHPEWLMVDRFGALQPCATTSEYIWVSPGIDSVRSRLAAVSADIARRYGPLGLKGIHLDRIRYPGNTFSWDAPSTAAYQQRFGVAPNHFASNWALFRRDQVTNGVREVADSIRAVNPSLVLSAAVFPGYKPVAGWSAQWGYTDLYQDPLAWAQQGALDIAVPMAYPAASNSASWTVKAYCTNTDWLCTLDQHRARMEDTAGRQVYIGVGAIRGWDEMQKQIDLGHGRQVYGFSVFDYTKVDAIPNAWSRLASGPFRHKATVPAMPWK